MDISFPLVFLNKGSIWEGIDGDLTIQKYLSLWNTLFPNVEQESVHVLINKPLH